MADRKQNQNPKSENANLRCGTCKWFIDSTFGLSTCKRFKEFTQKDSKPFYNNPKGSCHSKAVNDAS